MQSGFWGNTLISKKPFKDLHPAFGLAWCVVVLGAYYVFNAPYYVYKISIFGDFLLGMLR
jgi:hypothetical protein